MCDHSECNLEEATRLYKCNRCGEDREFVEGVSCCGLEHLEFRDDHEHYHNGTCYGYHFECTVCQGKFVIDSWGEAHRTSENSFGMAKANAMSKEKPQ